MFREVEQNVPNRNPVARPGEKQSTVVPCMTREDFATWKIPYLREFLASTGINTTGTKEMLVRNCFNAYELRLQEAVTDFLQEPNEVMKNHLDNLVIGKISLPDPYSLLDGWCNTLSHLADTQYNDVKDYLMKQDTGKDFKSGKSLLGSRHLCGIKTHNIDINVRFCFVEAIIVLGKGFQMQTMTFGVACTKMVGKLSMLVVLVLWGKLVPS